MTICHNLKQNGKEIQSYKRLSLLKNKPLYAWTLAII